MKGNKLHHVIYIVLYAQLVRYISSCITRVFLPCISYSSTHMIKHYKKKHNVTESLKHIFKT